MNQFIPDKILDWKTVEPVENYNRETIFKYMNGAGEVYRMFDYRSMIVKRFTSDKRPGITVELFDMGSPEDAYGIFSHSRESDNAGIGGGSEFKGGLLCFWKNRYFVCLITEKQTEDTHLAILELGRAIEKNIHGESKPPDLLRFLPDDGLDKSSIRYFHKHTSLNCHYYLSEHNILNLDDKTEAILAKYHPGNSYLLYVRYANQNLAKAALKSFRAGYIPEVENAEPVEVHKDKWVLAESYDNMVIIVFDAPDPDRAISLVNNIKEKIKM